MIAIPNMSKPKRCELCPCSYYSEGALSDICQVTDKPITDGKPTDCPLIKIVTCKECKHRPIKDDPDGADYGFNIVEPTDGDDICPCLVEDGWYSWMPNDNFYCGRGERRNDELNTERD